MLVYISGTQYQYMRDFIYSSLHLKQYHCKEGSFADEIFQRLGLGMRQNRYEDSDLNGHQIDMINLALWAEAKEKELNVDSLIGMFWLRQEKKELNVDNLYELYKEMEKSIQCNLTADFRKQLDNDLKLLLKLSLLNKENSAIKINFKCLVPNKCIVFDQAASELKLKELTKENKEIREELKKENKKLRGKLKKLRESNDYLRTEADSALAILENQRKEIKKLKAQLQIQPISFFGAPITTNRVTQPTINEGQYQYIRNFIYMNPHLRKFYCKRDSSFVDDIFQHLGLSICQSGNTGSMLNDRQIVMINLALSAEAEKKELNVDSLYEKVGKFFQCDLTADFREQLDNDLKQLMPSLLDKEEDLPLIRLNFECSVPSKCIVLDKTILKLEKEYEDLMAEYTLETQLALLPIKLEIQEKEIKELTARLQIQPSFDQEANNQDAQLNIRF